MNLCNSTTTLSAYKDCVRWLKAPEKLLNGPCGENNVSEVRNELLSQRRREVVNELRQKYSIYNLTTTADEECETWSKAPEQSLNGPCKIDYAITELCITGSTPRNPSVTVQNI